MSFTPTPSPNPWVQGINILINAAALGYAYWESKGGAENIFDYQDAPATGPVYQQLQVLFDKTPGVGSAVERELFNVNLLNITSGDPDSTWTAGDFSGIEARFDTWWTAQKVYHSTSLKLAGYKWFQRQVGVVSAGASHRLTLRSVAATASQDSLPAQVATSITLETGHRKHWGRIYLPAHTELNSDVYGRCSVGYVDAVALNWNNLMANLGTDQIFPVIVRHDPAGSTSSPPTKTPLELMTITGIHVDDVPDIIRRRRVQDVLYRKHYP